MQLFDSHVPRQCADTHQARGPLPVDARDRAQSTQFAFTSRFSQASTRRRSAGMLEAVAKLEGWSDRGENQFRLAPRRLT